MQSNSPAASGNTKTIKTWLIITLCCIPLVLGFVIFIVIGSLIYMADSSLPYKKRTAKAQPEIIKIEPTTWWESGSGSGTTRTPGHYQDGYKVNYKFTTTDGQIITQTDDKQYSKDPSRMVQVCYEPIKPSNSGLQSEGNCP